MRRIWRVAMFAFGPFRRTGNVMNWWPIIAGPLGFILTAVGLVIPHKVGGWWLAIAGLSLISLVLFAAVYRLHVYAFPNFPRHKIELGKPWVIEDPEADGEKLVLFDVAFTNRETDRRVHLTVDLFGHRLPRQAHLDPLRLFHHTRPLGRLKLISRPTDVAPQGRAEGAAVFSSWVPGVTQGDEGSDFTVPDQWEFFVRLTDDLSGAELEVPIGVARPDEVKTVLRELAPPNERLRQIAPLFGTELNEVRRAIEKAREEKTRLPSLPSFRWDEYDEDLNTHAPDIYPTVKQAYTAIHRVNQEGPVYYKVSAAYESAGEALDALDQPREEPYQTEAEKVAAELIAEIESESNDAT